MNPDAQLGQVVMRSPEKAFVVVNDRDREDFEKKGYEFVSRHREADPGSAPEAAIPTAPAVDAEAFVKPDVKPSNAKSKKATPVT